MTSVSAVTTVPVSEAATLVGILNGSIWPRAVLSAVRMKCQMGPPRS